MLTLFLLKLDDILMTERSADFSRAGCLSESEEIRVHNEKKPGNVCPSPSIHIPQDVWQILESPKKQSHMVSFRPNARSLSPLVITHEENLLMHVSATAAYVKHPPVFLAMQTAILILLSHFSIHRGVLTLSMLFILRRDNLRLGPLFGKVFAERAFLIAVAPFAHFCHAIS